MHQFDLTDKMAISSSKINTKLLQLYLEDDMADGKKKYILEN